MNHQKVYAEQREENCRKRPGILIFAGTTEGRVLAEYVSEYNCGQSRKENKIPCHVCTATEYGRSLLAELPEITVHAGRMESVRIKEFIEKNQIGLVIDATHPFAENVTENISAACRSVNMAAPEEGTDRFPVRYLRCIRSESASENISYTEKEGKPDKIVWVDSVAGAAEYLCGTSGNILIATGSKDLHLYTVIDEYRKRCYARVLSTPEAVEKSVNLGFTGRHLIAMQGPFSVEMNLALLKQTRACWFVTKESGSPGGFGEKIRAAALAGAVPVVVRRKKENGESLENVQKIIYEFAGAGCGGL